MSIFLSCSERNKESCYGHGPWEGVVVGWLDMLADELVRWREEDGGPVTYPLLDRLSAQARDLVISDIELGLFVTGAHVK